ncbi:MAG: protein-L-isoaspartate(D-aspartate) O-methyltransferase [Candidatus Saccharibacteria bacterium]
MEDLVNQLEQAGVLRNPAVRAAFTATDRRRFVRPVDRLRAYEDHPLSIGHGQTISQPYTVAFMLNLLDVRPGQKVLDIGCGSGWTTALLAQMVGPTGNVYGIEKISELVKFAQRNLAHYAFPNVIVEAPGETLGMPEQAPFDRILVSAAAETLPLELCEQLASPGIMVLPIGEDIVQVKKHKAGRINQEIFSGFAFVPLV